VDKRFPILMTAVFVIFEVALIVAAVLFST